MEHHQICACARILENVMTSILLDQGDIIYSALINSTVDSRYSCTHDKDMVNVLKLQTIIGRQKGIDKQCTSRSDWF